MDPYKLNLEAPWEEVKEQIKETNIDLTDEDLRLEPGKEKELLERLSHKMGKNIESVKCWIESISHTKGMAS
jgi:hypothetical protein